MLHETKLYFEELTVLLPQSLLNLDALTTLPTATQHRFYPVSNTFFGCCQRVSHWSAALCNWSVSDYFPATIHDRSGTFHTNFCTTLIWSGPTKLQVMDVTSVCWILLAACLFSIVSAGELKREPDFFFTLVFHLVLSIKFPLLQLECRVTL